MEEACPRISSLDPERPPGNFPVLETRGAIELVDHCWKLDAEPPLVGASAHVFERRLPPAPPRRHETGQRFEHEHPAVTPRMREQSLKHHLAPGIVGPEDVGRRMVGRLGAEVLRAAIRDGAVVGIGDGASIKAYDPVAEEEARELMPRGVEFAGSALEAVEGADAVVLVTEWPEFAELDLADAASRMSGKLVVDGRNFLEPDSVRAAGLDYEGIGRR